MKKRAVFLIESLNRGGVENMLLRVIPLLGRHGWHGIVMTIKDGGEMIDEYLQTNIEVHVLRYDSLLSPSLWRQVFQRITDLNPDIVVTTLLRADLIGRLIISTRTHIPVVSYIGTTYNHPRYWPARAIEWLTKPLARYYIANSSAVKEFYIRHLGVDATKVSVVANGLDVQQFRLAKGSAVRKELGLSPSDLVVTCVGNLAPNKGQGDLIEAFDRAFADNSRTHLLLVGDGEMRSMLEHKRQRLQSADRIHLLGRRTDVPAILRVTDIFALPTLFEGMSNAIMEAMAAGTAIVTTDIPENKVLVTDEKTAVLVPPKNVGTLARVLTRLHNDNALRQRLGQAALSTVKASYSLKQCAQNFAATLDSICRKKK